MTNTPDSELREDIAELMLTYDSLDSWIKRAPTASAGFLDELVGLVQAKVVEARQDELLEIGLLTHKFEGQDYHCREIADAIDERLAQLKTQSKSGEKG